MIPAGKELRTPTHVREAPLYLRGFEYLARGWQAVPARIASVRGRILSQRAKRQLAKLPRPYRLCLGSGRAPIPGWTNGDYFFPADVQLDLRHGIPVPDGSVELIYSEHLIEHFTLDDNLRLLAECARVLAPGGRMRIATPDLESLVRDYRTTWRDHDWVNWDEYGWISSGTQMLNTAVREWGHVYLWDFEELRQRLEGIGFRGIERFEIGASGTEALRSLETRADSNLIVEAVSGRGST